MVGPLGGDSVTRGSPHEWDWALIKETPEGSLVPLCWVRTQQNDGEIERDHPGPWHFSSAVLEWREAQSKLGTWLFQHCL